MKKALSLLLVFAMTASLAACGSQNAGTPPADDLPAATTPSGTSDPASQPADSMETPDTAAPSTDGETGGILIAYFSVIENRENVDTVANASRVGTTNGIVGNCQFIAQAIQQAVGGDLFAIETVQDYPLSHDALLDFAYQEMREDARPELSSEIENLDDYDVIFLGYPNWNADLPMPLYTFLESYDFSGKTIIPFVTHGGSGFSRTISTIADLQPNATVVENGLSISRGNVPNAAQEAMDWASQILN